jgi:Kef-type K+ transport system membrane component KefB
MALLMRMIIIIALLILLSASIIVGELFERIGIPAVAGQLVAGLLLGPTVLNIIAPSSGLSELSDIALFFIMFFIGVEVTTEVITKHVGHAFVLTATSFAIPAAIMALVAVFAFQLAPQQAVITAIALGIPSISIISVLLLRNRLLVLEDGHIILASVVITDVIGFGALAIVAGGISNSTLLLIAIVVFIALLLLVDRALRMHSRRLKRFFDMLMKKESGERIAFGSMLILGLLVSTLLQLIGITFVLGAFFAGMLISEYIVGKSFYRMFSHTLRRINNSFFIPLFFSVAALSVLAPDGALLLLLVTMVAISAVVGGALNFAAGRSLFRKIDGRSAAGLLGGRGSVGVIIGSIALLEGIISSNIYSIIVLGTLVMAITMPLLIKKPVASR